MDIKRLLDMAKIKPNPALDQFFLQDDEILDEEIRLAHLGTGDIVLEVGAGIGNLTIRLSKAARVIAVEKDYTFSGVLKGIKNIDVVLSDALVFLESLRTTKGKKSGRLENEKEAARSTPNRSATIFNKVVSNIPYSISQPLLLELFRHEWQLAVLIVQNEFAEKLVSKERLGMLMSDIADVKIVRDIPANAFYPLAVPSALVLIKQKKQLDDKFWKFLCTLKPNKNVSNQVKKYPKNLANKKAHRLSLKELKELYRLNMAKNE